MGMERCKKYKCIIFRNCQQITDDVSLLPVLGEGLELDVGDGNCTEVGDKFRHKCLDWLEVGV